jgi:NADPH:quinone reductase-like Zn-dependent oxidoreductase
MSGLRSEETKLVHSAGGGVGIAAIQLATHIGASVIGTASAHEHEFLRQLGVDHCIDYRSEDFEASYGRAQAERNIDRDARMATSISSTWSPPNAQGNLATRPPDSAGS